MILNNTKKLFKNPSVEYSFFSWKTILFLLVVSLIFSIITPLETQLSDVYYQIRGARDPGDHLMLVSLSDKDIEALGGWPVTRDYYGYMIHVLSQCGARVIGFDFLLDHENKQYPEYDKALSQFIKRSECTVLPCVLYGDEQTHSMVQASDAVCPALIFQGADIGFSNLGSDKGLHSIPVVRFWKDKPVFSFGLVLAARFLNCDMILEDENTLVLKKQNMILDQFPLNRGQISLNHLGPVHDIPYTGFVDLLQRYEQSPDSIDLQDKLVLVAATATSLPVIRHSPFGRIPASFVHLTLAENIIEGNMLHDTPWILRYCLVLCLMAVLVYLPFRFRPVLAGLMALCCLAIYFILSYLGFVLFHQTGVCALPLTGGAFLFSVYMIIRWRIQKKTDSMHYDLLESEILKTRQALSETEEKLVVLQKEMNAQSHDAAQLSEQSLRLAREKREAVETLERHLRDLRAFQTPSVSEKNLSHDQIIFTAKSAMADVIAAVKQVAVDDIPVLITGETGTGKELIARAIHQESGRSKAPFVAVNCGALPETLLESELFGHEKGSFTGATARRRGRFEMAGGGTLFLDEITETTPAFQARLLRALQEKTIERVGSESSIRVDVRIVAASNQDVKACVSRQTFRSDLYFRINGFHVSLPPLRERIEDLPALTAHFIEQYQYDRVQGLSESAMNALKAYAWPGNIRELENVIRRGALLASNNKKALIQIDDLPEDICSFHSFPEKLTSFKPMEQQVLELMRRFAFSRASVSSTARSLGNRDRGTITEYLRGLCFEALVEHHYDLEKTVASVAGTDDENVKDKVRIKISGYLNNLKGIDPGTVDLNQPASLPSVFRGLPKKYHASLKAILEHRFNL